MNIFGSDTDYRFSCNPKCKFCGTAVYYTEKWDSFLGCWIYVPNSTHYNRELARRKYRDIIELNDELAV